MLVFSSVSRRKGLWIQLIVYFSYDPLLLRCVWRFPKKLQTQIYTQVHGHGDVTKWVTGEHNLSKNLGLK